MIRTLTLIDTSIISYYYFTIIFCIIIVNTVLRDTMKDITRLPMLSPFICVALSLPFPCCGKLTAQSLCCNAQPSALTTTVCSHGTSPWDFVPGFPLWSSPLSTSSCRYCVLSRTPDFPLFHFRSQDYTEVASWETLLPPYFSSSLLVSVNRVFLE